MWHDKKCPLVLFFFSEERRDTVKLRGSPKALDYQAAAETRAVARLIAWVWSKRQRYNYMDDPQPSPKDCLKQSTDAVHRLNGSGLLLCFYTTKASDIVGPY